MDHFPLKCVCVVLIFVSCLNISLCLVPSNSLDNSMDSNGHQNEEKMYSSMWFGPRMGKKKRAEKLSERSKISDLIESLAQYPWTFIAVNDMEKRGNTHNFTPRLGRTLDDRHTTEDLVDTPDRSAAPFSPRFGRGRFFSPYSPRLGRDESSYA